MCLYPVRPAVSGSRFIATAHLPDERADLRKQQRQASCDSCMRLALENRQITAESSVRRMPRIILAIHSLGGCTLFARLPKSPSASAARYANTV